MFFCYKVFCSRKVKIFLKYIEQEIDENSALEVAVAK